MKTILLKMLASKLLKGKITYAGIITMLLPLVGQLLGVDIADGDISKVVEAVGAVVATYGRMRAAHQGE